MSKSMKGINAIDKVRQVVPLNIFLKREIKAIQKNLLSIKNVRPQGAQANRPSS
ncbi:MAG TPA: hypothetical protein GXX75_18300 [Clostridiales bacterium]|nr:hypothetical protein [Clostridiales bacterium]